MRRTWCVVAGALMVCGGSACGGGSDQDSAMAPPGGAASAAGSASAGTTAGGSSAGTTAGGNSAGTTAGGSSGTAGTASVGRGCRGVYGTPAPVFSEEDSQNFSINGVSVTSDELLVVYSRSELQASQLTQTLMFRDRATKGEPFGQAQPLPELTGVCKPNQHVNPDISDDGLTLYVTCTDNVAIGLSEGKSPLRVARRTSRDASFVLDAEPIGSVFASVAVSADELSAYSGGEIFDTAPQLFRRPTKNDSFGAAEPVPGFTMGLSSPDISADGLTLFGSTPLDPTQRVLARASRASLGDDFGPLEVLDLGLMNAAVGAPNVTPDCSLYFVSATTTSSVQVSRPQ